MPQTRGTRGFRAGVEPDCLVDVEFAVEVDDEGVVGDLHGVDAELGVYYYYAKIICGNKADHVIEMKGDVTLIR